jgi:hypothetical protein
LIHSDELARLEGEVQRALIAGTELGLRILGYGEITLVLGWPTDDPVFACKRLPQFRDRATCDAYLTTIADYLDVLRQRGIDVVETELLAVDTEGGVAGYAVQPVLDAATLGPAVLAAAVPSARHPLLGAVFDATLSVLDSEIGLDPQLSNWVWDDGRLRYLDVTTPFFWYPDGRLRLDLHTLVMPLPWALRAAVRRFVAGDVLQKYRIARPTLLDFCGNLLKDALAAWLPAAIEAANARITPPFTESEVRKAYAADARIWAFMLRMRRADRTWQRKVRRRAYPYLLPGPISR